MKVLFLTNIPSPYRVDFFNRLGRLCDLTVWFEARNEANREWETDERRFGFRYKFLPGRTFGLDKHTNLSVLRALRAERFDVYVIGGYSSPTEMLAIHWLKLRKRPFLLSSDGGFPASEPGLLRKFKSYLISSASGWLSSGSNCTRYLTHYGAQPSRIYEYPFSSVSFSEEELAPLAREERARLKREEGLQETVILAVGQFVPRKGFDVLLEAFARMRRGDVSLLLIGGGPERERYETLIRERGLANVRIKPFMSKSELIPYFKVADLFAMPTRYDVWGLVVNEAAAFGLPIVSTRMAGAALDLVAEGENGYLVDADDAAALADRCERLAGDEILRQRFGRKSRELSRLYTMERMVNRHADLLHAWIDGSPQYELARE
ncbi:glycosyltransferase family 4 protein [Cohnella nanjingensis]|uniref:Glycosyltransferase family 4 protein n=1 Tax=Cohnella nanjingensis TaxID=1387779 RepID=A0A7X0RQH3_9BACL|nr:glycosyltransferase family 4 protein [Cohnella nanjingensis]MBB6671690.1 glycosyltransferase family 4 protein [Cohnella nanjingensis]